MLSVEISSGNKMFWELWLWTFLWYPRHGLIIFIRGVIGGHLSFNHLFSERHCTQRHNKICCKSFDKSFKIGNCKSAPKSARRVSITHGVRKKNAKRSTPWYASCSDGLYCAKVAKLWWEPQERVFVGIWIGRKRWKVLTLYFKMVRTLEYVRTSGTRWWAHNRHKNCIFV